MHSLVVDISNLLFRVAAVQKHKITPGSGEDLVGLCMHTSLFSIHKWYRKFKPDFVVFAFEGRNNWRKSYTTNNDSRLPYKGNRVPDPEMAHFFELITSFQETVTHFTSICCLCVDTMEADDVIGCFCQQNASLENKITILSGDQDFIQLLKLPNVQLINPDDGKPRNEPGSKNYEPDIDYWLFQKCIRGDMGDYVPSAYPRVRETNIRKAYDDPYAMTNFMNHVWKDGDAEYKVKDLYEENRILLDLSCQPNRPFLEQQVQEQTKQVGQYNYFQLLKFLNKYELNSVSKKAKEFNDLFMHNQLYLKGVTTVPVIKEDEAEKPKRSLLAFD